MADLTPNSITPPNRDTHLSATTAADPKLIRRSAQGLTAGCKSRNREIETQELRADPGLAGSALFISAAAPAVQRLASERSRANLRGHCNKILPGRLPGTG